MIQRDVFAARQGGSGLFASLAMLLAVTLLTACGGGGRFVGPASAPIADLPLRDITAERDAAFAHPEFANQNQAGGAADENALNRINAHYAYGWSNATSVFNPGRRVSGEGVNIGYGTPGLQHKHPKIDANLLPTEQALIKGLTAEYYPGVDGYPEMRQIHADYITHINDLDLDSFTYVAAACDAGAGEYQTAPNTDCPAGTYFIDFSASTAHTRMLRVIPDLEQIKLGSQAAGLASNARNDELLGNRNPPADAALPVHGVAFNSRIVPYVAGASLNLTCSDRNNEQTAACLSANDIKSTAGVDKDLMLSEYIHNIPAPNAPDAVDIFLMEFAGEGNGIAYDKDFLARNLDHTLLRLRNFLDRRNNPLMVVRSGYDDFEGQVGASDAGVIRGPRVFAALPYHFDYLRGRMLTAVALNIDDNNLNENSPRCGGLPTDWNAERDGRHYCLSAPAEALRINGAADTGIDDLAAGYRNGDDENRDYQIDLGAAALVTGSLALLHDRFRGELSGKELGLRLVNTADRQVFFDDATLFTADPAPQESDDEATKERLTTARNARILEVYGAGMIDLQAATSPIGASSIPAGASLGGASFGLDATRLSLSPAFGDGIALGLGAREIAVFDETNAPFWYPLASLTSISSSRQTLLNRRAEMLDKDDNLLPLSGGGFLSLSFYHDGGLFSDNRGSERWADRYQQQGQSHFEDEYKLSLSLRQPLQEGIELLFAAGEIADLPLGLHSEQGFEHPYLGFAGEGVGMGGTIELGAGRLTALGFSGSESDSGAPDSDATRAAHGGLLQYAFAPTSATQLGIQAGALIEEDRALGLHSKGGFGDFGSTSTAFAGMSLQSTLGSQWRLRAQALGGMTEISTPSTGLIGDVSGVVSSALRFGFEGRDILYGADKMSFFIEQPLRVENGEASFLIPIGRTQEGALRRERIGGVSLAPGGRELDLSTRYQIALDSNTRLSFSSGVVLEGGHVEQQETEVYALGDLQIRF